MKPQTKITLQVLFLCFVALYIGIIFGMAWQMEVTRRSRPDKAAMALAHEKELGTSWAAGYSWGKAECAGEDSE